MNPGRAASADGQPLRPLSSTYAVGGRLPALALHPGEEAGRAFYESKAAHAAPGHPWTTWPQLHQWEREREAVTAWAMARSAWAQAHREATVFPACIPAVWWSAGEVDTEATPVTRSSDPKGGT